MSTTPHGSLSWRTSHEHGIEIVFLNRAIGVSPEEDLFLQMQSMFAEYERAKIRLLLYAGLLPPHVAGRPDGRIDAAVRGPAITRSYKSGFG